MGLIELLRYFSCVVDFGLFISFCWFCAFPHLKKSSRFFSVSRFSSLSVLITPVQKRAFKDKRSKHYDEFSNVRKARELIAKELAELEKEEDEVRLYLQYDSPIATMKNILNCQSLLLSQCILGLICPLWVLQMSISLLSRSHLCIASEH